MASVRTGTGIPTNTPGSIAVAVLIMLLIISMFYGLNSSFSRSQAWGHASIGVTALIALPVSLLCALQAKRSGLEGIRLNFFYASMLIAFLFVFMGLLLFFSVAYTVPDLYTRNAGQTVELRHIEITRRKMGGVRGCIYQVHSLDFARSPLGYYCAGRSEFEGMNDSGLARAYARLSWFGAHVYFVESEAPAPQPLSPP